MPQRCDGLRILLVEDDADSREILAQTLILEGATVTAVSTASNALALLLGADLIPTDFALPGDDGVWLLERVNKQPRPIPVIVMSGYDERQEPRLATAPFARKLLKPLDFDRVCAEVAAALDGSARRMPPSPSVDLDARGRRLRATLAAPGASTPRRPRDAPLGFKRGGTRDADSHQHLS